MYKDFFFGKKKFGLVKIVEKNVTIFMIGRLWPPIPTLLGIIRDPHGDSTLSPQAFWIVKKKFLIQFSEQITRYWNFLLKPRGLSSDNYLIFLLESKFFFQLSLSITFLVKLLNPFLLETYLFSIQIFFRLWPCPNYRYADPHPSKKWSDLHERCPLCWN